MPGKSAIAWCDLTWNPPILAGCFTASPGCYHCYARGLHNMRYQAQVAGAHLPPQYSEIFDRPRLFSAFATPEQIEKRWRYPLTMQRRLARVGQRARCFVNSMSDLFYGEPADRSIIAQDDDGTRSYVHVPPDELLIRCYEIMRACPNITFQILTKRAQRMQEWCAAHADLVVAPNIWHGVSVEDQHRADERIPWLLRTPSSVRFISAEPLLGPVDLLGVPDDGAYGPIWHKHSVQYRTDYGTGIEWDVYLQCGIDWVICGAESGPKHRPMDLDWVRALRDQCALAGAAFFFKQSVDAKGHKTQLPALDGQVWDQYPTDGQEASA